MLKLEMLQLVKENLMLRKKSSYTVSVVSNKYKYESEEVKQEEKGPWNPEFNWDFHIKIETGAEKNFSCFERIC